jgi:hypothetical protein
MIASRYAYLIPGFIAVARTNGLSNLWAALPASHELIKTNRVAQIRKVKGILASGVDELGNVTTLGVDGLIRQC